MPALQFKYFLLTIPHYLFTPYLPPNYDYIRGQLESGNDTNYLHWQLLVISSKKLTVTAVKRTFGDACHVEPSRSNRANDYVWKDDTAIIGTRFELGSKPLNRNSEKDWEVIRNLAREGRLDDLPGDVYIRHYNNLKRIAADHMQPVSIERTIHCYWGRTGLGKSRRAWEEAGLDAYPKDPRSKFWDGYRSQKHVVIDEFRGGIDISHMLRWLDRYPVVVEVKGSSVVFSATHVWITSNLHPRDWYPNLDQETMQALLRRMNIVHFDGIN